MKESELALSVAGIEKAIVATFRVFRISCAPLNEKPMQLGLALK
jgi:hypothetical protein